MSDTEQNEQPEQNIELQLDDDDNNPGQPLPENLPVELANLLQQLHFHTVGQELFGDNEELDALGSPRLGDPDEPREPQDFTKMSTITFVEPTFAVHYDVRTRHQHSQLLNLCELTGGFFEAETKCFYSKDESGLYVFSYDKALDENKYKESLESDTEYKEEPQDEESPWSSQPIKKFDFKTKKLFKVPGLTLTGTYCLACKHGYIAVNNSGVVQVVHEATGKVVEGELKASEDYHQTNNVFFGSMKKPDGEEQVVLLVSKNGGEITMFDLNQEGDRFVAKLRQHIPVNRNINHSAFGFFEFGNYLIGAPDYAEGPIIYQMDEAEVFTKVDTFLTFPKKGTSAMMCSWQAQGPLFAMATERGECVVWHFPSRERVKVLLNCGKKFQKLKEEEERRKNGEPEPAEDDNKSNSSEGSYNDYYSAANQYVRIAKFNPVPLFNYILVYAESHSFVHIVDTRTWDEQIIQTNEGINGLCFSSDGRKIYVATDTRITEYELILRTSLLETCLHHIRANLDKKETFGWNLEALPYDLQFKLNY